MSVNPTTIMDCYSIAHMPYSQASSEALLNVCATIKAAEIQANATILSGWYTLLSGVLAFLAGLLAGGGGIYAARKQYQHTRRTVLFKQRVFITKLSSLMHLADDELDAVQIQANRIITRLRSRPALAFSSLDHISTENIQNAIDFMSFEYISQIYMASPEALNILANLSAELGQILNDIRETRKLLVNIAEEAQRKNFWPGRESQLDTLRKVTIDLSKDLSQRVKQIKSYEPILAKSLL